MEKQEMIQGVFNFVKEIDLNAVEFCLFFWGHLLLILIIFFMFVACFDDSKSVSARKASSIICFFVLFIVIGVDFSFGAENGKIYLWCYIPGLLPFWFLFACRIMTLEKLATKKVKIRKINTAKGEADEQSRNAESTKTKEIKND